MGQVLKLRVGSWRSALLAGAMLLARSAPGQQEPQLFSIAHPAMGTTFTLYLYAPSKEAADADAAPVFDEIDRIEDLLSNYRETSELSRINREASQASVTTDPETFDFLSTSIAWSARSQGAFDITVGKLMEAWGFFHKQGRIPTNAELATLRQETGWQKVQLDPVARTVHFSSPGVTLDPGGIGKGFAVDKAVAILRAEHVGAAMLSAGSSTIYALGAPPGQPGWKVVVPDPLDASRALSTVILRDTSLSSASCAEKHFILAGHLYCHIMDPAQLCPVEEMLQVTIVDPSATSSDALSNVLFVKQPAESARFMRSLPGDAALIISGTKEKPVCHPIHWSDTIDPQPCTKESAAHE
jgi:FAD:protein FMN transferase